jgi:peptidylprolyl isomerase domain and WD repeat-containing protein 1
MQTKKVPMSLNFSPDFTRFVTFGFADRLLRLFSFASGKILRKYDESLEIVSEMQQAGTAGVSMDAMEFGRRLAVEKEIGGLKGGQASTANAGTYTTLYF